MATRTTKHLDRVASPGLTSADLLRLILKERNKSADTVEPGFKGPEQFAKEWCMSGRRAQEILLEGSRLGILERKTFRVMCQNGSIRKLAFYKPVKKG